MLSSQQVDTSSYLEVECFFPFVELKIYSDLLIISVSNMLFIFRECFPFNEI